MALTKKTIAGTAGAAAIIAASCLFISPFEGLSLVPYKDIAGVTTWCKGETQGTPKARYTPQECDAMLNARVSKDYYGVLAKCIVGFTSLPPPVQISTTSFAYNLGTGTACNKSVGQLLSRGHIEAACKAMLDYNNAKVKGVLRKVKGLDTRRKAESALCMKGA